MRLVSFVAVVLIHAVSKTVTDHPQVADAIAILSRFAVPYFFIAFGFLLSPRSSTQTGVRLLGRLMPPFIFWALAYVLYFRGTLAGLASPAMIARLLLTGLDGQHLWFLPALGVAGLLFVMLRHALGWRAVLVVAIVFYAFALAFGPYRLLFDLPRPPFNTRNGPFFGFMFILAGAWLRTHAVRLHWSVALLLVAVTGALQWLEVQALVASGLLETGRYVDDTLMTIGFGVAVFLLALSIPPTVRLPKLLASLAELSLGLYVVHLFFLDLCGRAFGMTSLAQCLVNAVLAVLASVLCVLILDRVPLTRRLIR
jgi:surface polysaccharide O-acyltransferase-like enzyme